MWVLISLNNPDERHPLLCGRDYVVGRKDCDILIGNDQSISRRHAVLHAVLTQHCSENNIGLPYNPPVLSLTDSSKLGTLVEQAHVLKRRVDIQPGDKVQFGNSDNGKYKAVFEPFMATTSCLDTASKRTTKQLMTQLGGHLVAEWRKQCDMLIMSSLSVTVKVICALVSQKPVVTPAYLDALINAISSSAKIPEPDAFVPLLVDSQINPAEVSFKADARRKTLFQGKIFIFLSPKQFKSLSLCIELSGGMPMLMEEGTDDNEDDILTSDATCVMHYDPADTSQVMSQNAHDWLKHVTDILKKHKKRAISSSEIGYAVLFCSTEKYCNPTKELIIGGRSIPSQSLSEHVASSQRSQNTNKAASRRVQQSVDVQSAFVPQTETETSFEKSQNKSEICIDTTTVQHSESIPKASTSHQKKRIREEDNTDTPMAKQQKIDDLQPALSKLTNGQFKLPAGPSKPLKTESEVVTLHAAASERLMESSENTVLCVKQEISSPVVEEQKYRQRTLFNQLTERSPVMTKTEKEEEEGVLSSHVINSPTSHVPRLNIDESESTADRVQVPASKKSVMKMSTSCRETDVQVCNRSRPEGFINSYQPDLERTCDHVKEEDMPSDLLIIVETPLVVTNQTKRAVHITSELPLVWKGKPVKNFKKFRKSCQTANVLPRIIGRSDMEVYDNSNRQDLDDFFTEQLQAESQQNEMDRLAAEMFNWEPSRASKKKSRY